MTTPDRRVRRTRDALHAALIGLMMERAYDRITVSDVIERANIGRSTFYAHYRDKDELLVVSCTEFLRAEIGRGPDDGPWAPVRVMIALAAGHPDVYRPLVGPKSSAAALRGYRRSVATILREHLSANPGLRSDDLMVGALSWAIIGLLTEVSDTATPADPAAAWHLFESMVSGL
ncbi:TetR/AcrR family transcriptional regulator [Nocardia sp. NPDC024068]|uniref:TetR/AcrR family transcriptional regulator n=1 Tax=Nocardia sp. NPDC024068 TaxID=3157197 RepID=UPI0033E3556F